MQVEKQQLEMDMQQQTFPNWERSMSRLYIDIYNLAYLTYMQSTSCEMLGWNQDHWEKYQ